MSNYTLKERMSRFLHRRIDKLERDKILLQKDIEDTKNMYDRINNSSIDDKEFNSMLGIVKFYYNNKDKDTEND